MRHAISQAAGLALFLALPQIAQAAALDTFDGLSRALKPGDIVSVTEWSGAQTTGRVAELSTCSIVLLTEARKVEIPATVTKKVKLLQRGNDFQGTADAGGRCHEPSCMVVALTFGGAKAIGRLFNRAKTIYRAPARFTAQAQPCRQG